MPAPGNSRAPAPSSRADAAPWRKGDFVGVSAFGVQRPPPRAPRLQDRLVVVRPGSPTGCGAAACRAGRVDAREQLDQPQARRRPPHHRASASRSGCGRARHRRGGRPKLPICSRRDRRNGRSRARACRRLRGRNAALVNVARERDRREDHRMNAPTWFVRASRCGSGRSGACRRGARADRRSRARADSAPHV